MMMDRLLENERRRSESWLLALHPFSLTVAIEMPHLMESSNCNQMYSLKNYPPWLPPVCLHLQQAYFPFIQRAMEVRRPV